MDTDIKKLDIKKCKYKESKTKPFPPSTLRYCNFCRKETRWFFNPTIGHSQCSNCGLRKVPILKNLIDSEGNIITKDKKNINRYNKQNRHKQNKQNRYNKQNHNQNRNQNYNQNIFLTELLNKSIRCILTNSTILEGILIAINQYEIILMIDDKKIIILKGSLMMVDEKR